MSRFLRHPVRAIREPFGKAGLIVACIALVFALVGGAYAAGKLSSKQQREVKKIVAAEIKKHPGLAGAPGGQGNPGPAGAAGKDGANGTDGAGVTTTALEPGEGPEGEECAKGGIELHSASGVNVICNGEKGEPGETGNPAEFPKSLPAGRSESGTWLMSSMTEKTQGSYHVGYLTVSFPIPLKPGDGYEPHFLKPGETTAECPGENNSSEWVAEPGNLCVYAKLGTPVFSSSSTASLSLENQYYGDVIEVANNTAEAEEENLFATGPWVMTAPE